MVAISATSIGQLCAYLQQPISRIRRAIEALKVEPAIRLNNVDHYSDDDCERVRDYLLTQAQKEPE